MSRRLYALHRWLSAIAFLQLVVWTMTGLFFAVVPMSRVHGEHVEGAHELPIGPGPGALSPTSAMACFAAMGISEVSRLELRALPAGLFYIARRHDGAARIDARTGAYAPVEQAEAESTARRDQPGDLVVRSAERIEKAGVEYRGKPLPAWRVALADEAGTVVYVDARTGEITARRNDTWRTYDFLWSLHIMSYDTREGFNHPLIIGAASLAVLTVLSGIVLWGIRLARWVRRRGNA
jgi:hypothetical protein